MAKSPVIGILLIFVAIIDFAVNMNLWHPPIIYNLLPSVFWNPLSFFTPRLVGHIWLLSAAAGAVVDFFMSIFWSFMLFVFGIFLL
jgi:hypothetical protein